MYDNIGSKIKKLAVILAIAGAVAFFVIGAVCLTLELIGAALVTMFIGPLLAWVSSFVLYGFGELIDKVSNIEKHLSTQPEEKKEAIIKVKQVGDVLDQKEEVSDPVADKKYQNAIKKAEDFKSDFFALDYRIRTYEAVIKDLEELAENNYKDAAEKVEEYKSYLADLKTNEKKGGCYIATCVYGSYDCPQVWTLRRYRDNCLGKSWYGRLFIRFYYAVSPKLVKWFGNTSWFKSIWKNRLDKMVQKLQGNGVDSTPYQDQNW